MTGVQDLNHMAANGEAAAASVSDRRGGQRYMTVLQTGRIVSDRAQDLCLIKNISENGMMVRFIAPVKPNERLLIDFKSGRSVHARVAWVKDNIAGLEFEQPLDVREILSPASSDFVLRAPRLEIDMQVRVKDDEQVETVGLINISQTGAQIERFRFARLGERVRLEIPGLLVMESQIRWVSEDRTGLAFVNSISFDRLATWAANLTPRRILCDFSNESE